MTKIKRYVEHMDEELCGAKDYAEKYLEAKAAGQSEVAEKYKEMAADELKHATYVHNIAVDEIEKIKKVFTPPQDMLARWEKAHSKYIDRAAKVKGMLAM